MADKKTVKTPVKKEIKTVKKTAKTAVKTVKKETVKSTKTVEKPAVKKPTGLKTDVYAVDGSVTGSVTLPKSLFGAKINTQLMTQAVRVYLANQREGSAKTKTRGQVEGSTRKIYKQKGTGKARHGAIRAPIFVGGGIVFGPELRDYSLSLPQKMKVRALASALTKQYQDGAVRVLSGFNGLDEKTKAYSTMVQTVAAKAKTLVVVSSAEQTSQRFLRNIQHVSVMRSRDLHTYAVLSGHSILFTEASLAELPVIA